MPQMQKRLKARGEASLPRGTTFHRSDKQSAAQITLSGPSRANARLLNRAFFMPYESNGPSAGRRARAANLRGVFSRPSSRKFGPEA